jgi:hypothetical protein
MIGAQDPRVEKASSILETKIFIYLGEVFKTGPYQIDC